MLSDHVAILGGGNMGRAILAALLQRGLRPERISVGESFEASRTALARDYGVTATPDNAEAIALATVIVLAVKPQDAAAALRPLRTALSARRPLLLSVAAGLRVATLADWCGPGVPIVRAMPNRPALVGAGATGMYAAPGVELPQRDAAERVMTATGIVVWVHEESALDTVTALSGSGPAYFFLLAELMMRAAISMGLAPDAAKRLAVETLHGAGKLAQASDGDLARLRGEVTSKGGTTEAAIRAFQSADLEGTVARALEAAAVRSRELGRS